MAELTLREQLQADWDSLSETGGDETPADGALQGDNRAQGAAGAEAGALSEAAPEPADTQQDGRSRDERGRFAPKTDNAPAAAAQPGAEEPISPETAQPAEAAPVTGTNRPPPSLPAAVKAKFAGLDPDVQQAFVALEGSVQQAKAEWGKKGERLNRFEEILAPHIDRWRMNGLDEVSGIQTLLAAQSVLDRDPVAGIREIARSYGLTPAHLAQAFGVQQTSVQQQHQGAAYGQTPELQAALQGILEPVVRQVQTQQQQLTSFMQAGEEARISQFAKEIEAFAGSDDAPFFDNVADDVMERVRVMRAAGQEASMELVRKAYDAAVWANPETRSVLLNQQAQQRAQDIEKKAAERAQRERAQRAQAASGSVTGSPSAGATPPRPAQGSIRDSLVDAMREHGAI